MPNVRRLTSEDLPRVRKFWKERWGDEFIVAHGVVYHPDLLDGFLVWQSGEIMGLITVAHTRDACEIVSLDSVDEEKGIGSALIEAVVQEARSKGCRRLFLITTNDNLRAIGFFQKRGFEIAAIHRGAVNVSRKIKPDIPLIGENGIPLRDEIEMEMILNP